MDGTDFSVIEDPTSGRHWAASPAGHMVPVDAIFDVVRRTYRTRPDSELVAVARLLDTLNDQREQILNTARQDKEETK